MLFTQCITYTFESGVVLENLYISLSFLIVGAILYKIKYSPIIAYIGYSFWWAGWAWLVSWIITLIFDIALTKPLALTVIVVLMGILYGGKFVFKHHNKNK